MPTRTIEENCMKYAWGKLPNGNYAIANVPVFQVFSDVEHGTVDQEKAKEILKNFEIDKRKGYFPRVFIGHHPDNSAENRPGAGFLNNLTFDGRFFFADIVEIPDDVFKEIQSLKYPNRSVEYNDEKQKITGMALLESQPPFFQFPILFLEKTEQLNKFQLSKYCVSNVQNSINAKGIKMTKEIKDDKKIEMVEDKGEGLNFCQQKYQELSDSTATLIKELDAKVNKIADALVKLLSMEGEEAEMQGRDSKMQDDDAEIQEVPEKIEDPADEEIPGDEDEEKIGKKPGSVAYQLRQIRKEISNLKGGYPSHRMSNPTAPMIERGSFLQKYQAKSIGVQKIAREASDAWVETSNHPNKGVASKFQAAWPSQEKFVDYMVKMEEIDPGYFRKMTM